MATDTIAAISTPLGEAELGLSDEWSRAVEIAKGIFQPMGGSWPGVPSVDLWPDSG